MCKQARFRNDSSPHPLPPLENEQLHPELHFRVMGETNMGGKNERSQVEMSTTTTVTLLWGLLLLVSGEPAASAPGNIKALF